MSNVTGEHNNNRSKISLDVYKTLCGPLNLHTLTQGDMNRVVMKMIPSFNDTNVVDFSYMFEKYTVIGIIRGEPHETKVYLRKHSLGEDIIVSGNYIDSWIDFGNTPIVAFESVSVALTEFYKIERESTK